MKTLQWAAAALAVGALALPSGAETVTTNDWWDVRFESPTPTGVNLEIGELGALTNFDNQALGTVKPYLSGQWSMIDGDESYVTNEFNTVTTNGVTFGGDWCIKLDTQGNDLTWTPTNNPVADITTLVDADLYLVGSDSPPDASDFDGTSDVQTAIYLKNETDEATGETTNSVLCVYVRNSSGGNYWQELDGVERLDNVIVIGASNRVDMIDPAVLRPGRLDVKIRVDRPDETQALAIVSRYLTAGLPYAPGTDAAALAHALVDDVYRRDGARALARVTFDDGARRTLDLADVVSGAMLRNIVDRVKTNAVKASVRHKDMARIDMGMVADAVRDEYASVRDTLGDVDASQWAKVNAIGGGHVVELRRLPTAYGDDVNDDGNEVDDRRKGRI